MQLDNWLKPWHMYLWLHRQQGFFLSSMLSLWVFVTNTSITLCKGQREPWIYKVVDWLKSLVLWAFRLWGPWTTRYLGASRDPSRNTSLPLVLSPYLHIVTQSLRTSDVSSSLRVGNRLLSGVDMLLRPCFCLRDVWQCIKTSVGVMRRCQLPKTILWWTMDYDGVYSL